MPTIDVSELITDPDFAQSFSLVRTTGEYINGRWTETLEETLTRTGVISPASAKELRQLPEADRVEGTISIFTKEIMYITSDAGTELRSSDKVLWKSHYYKIISVENWSDWGEGFYHALAQRITGN